MAGGDPSLRPRPLPLGEQVEALVGPVHQVGGAHAADAVDAAVEQHVRGPRPCCLTDATGRATMATFGKQIAERSFMKEAAVPTRRLPATRRSSAILAHLQKYIWLYILLMPGLTYLIIFKYGPMYGVIIAFKDFRLARGIWGSEWIGFENF